MCQGPWITKAEMQQKEKDVFTQINKPKLKGEN